MKNAGCRAQRQAGFPDSDGTPARSRLPTKSWLLLWASWARLGPPCLLTVDRVEVRVRYGLRIAVGLRACFQMAARKLVAGMDWQPRWKQRQLFDRQSEIPILRNGACKRT